MNDILQTLLEKHQVRRSRRQKDAFEAYIRQQCQEAGYDLRGENHQNLLKSRNLIAGDPEKARVIFTAHYDTCSEMLFPNLIYPQRKWLSILAQMPTMLLLVGVTLGAGFLMGRVLDHRAAFFIAYALYWVFFLLIFFGPANPHTANDNTSGVAALMGIMARLPQELRPDAAFIFFDHEEMGKVGSKQYAKAHPGITEGKVLLNLDCVGDGQDFLIVAPKGADERLTGLLREAFQPEAGRQIVHCSAENTNYNSDQKSFPNGVAVEASRKGRWGYHTSRIHTRRDVICEESNLDYLSRCAVKLARLVSHQSEGGNNP